MTILAIPTAEPNSKQINKGLTMKAMIKGVIIRKSYVWCLIVHNMKGHSE